MLYVSTRGGCGPVTASKAILEGIAPDGGLYTPSEIPKISDELLKKLCKADYCGRAAEILSLFLTDYTREELENSVKSAYADFDHPEKAPLVKLDEGKYVLELFHGPTCAFKDMALQLLPYLMTLAIRKNGGDDRICILVATSGDTGKAALEGFKDVEGTSIIVFYPRDGVSAVQRRQMTTQKGENVFVCAVKGNFDDAQTGVKTIFGDADFAAELAEKGVRLSSANSINWGRLVPQIVYYVSAYCDLVNSGAVEMGETVDVSVPTGNFGDILAAFYAMRMGVPIGRLICASNKNNVLTDFINTGVYDSNRPFFLTSSPSMDILISSNVERLLFELSGHDGEGTARYMKALKSEGKYTLAPELFASMKEIFAAGCADDDEVITEIRHNKLELGYLTDPHTAVASKVACELCGDPVCLIVSTASPYKFCGTVLKALTNEDQPDSVTLFEKLETLTDTAAPKPLKDVVNAKERFNGVTEKSELKSEVRRFIDSQTGGR